MIDFERLLHTLRQIAAVVDREPRLAQASTASSCSVHERTLPLSVTPLSRMSSSPERLQLA